MGIPAEQIKYGGNVLHQTIFELCQKIWEDEELSEEWKKPSLFLFAKKATNLIVITTGVYHSEHDM